MDTKFFLMGKIIGEEGGSGDKPDLVDLTATDNGTYRHVGHDGYDTVTVNVPKGITPTGNINITTTSQTDVTNYATAQVVDSDLTASNIKKDVDILGVVGTYEAEADLEDITITQNGTYTHSGKDGYDEVVVAVPEPSGNINITDTNSTNVSAYATAQVVDSDLVAGNIKKDVNILGVVGTYEAGGSTPDIESLSISANGTYTATNCDGYSPITVAVPNSYAAGDEGKVVSNGALVSQSSTTKNANGTYDTTLNNEVVVNVANSYTSGDEGKVVSSGALVAQTSATKTSNGTYDTTLNNEIVVNVPQGITPTGNINITDMQSTDVTNYATAQVVDSDLVAGNIKKDVNILGVTGTYEGSGGGGTNPDEGFVFKLNSNSGQIEEVEWYRTNGTAVSTKLGMTVTGFFGAVKKFTFPSSINISDAGSISEYMFDNWQNLTTINNWPLIWAQPININGYAFENCKKLSMGTVLNLINFSDVVSIGASAFFKTGSDVYQEGSVNGYALKIGDKLTTIGNNAFKGAIGLTSVYIKSTLVTSIGRYAFQDCTYLTHIYVPWSQGDVSNAPWGATNATVHYNCDPTSWNY